MEYGSVREMIYAQQRMILSPRAAFDEESRGRERPVRESLSRGEYQRDRDRVLHSKAFRRLSHKTQVFLSPEADHYRTRLTHTLEVTQIARTIARCLRLNEDLTEAVGLGHDLGHTPFGHAGERALQKVYDPSFTHYNQSLRVVEKLENLNLTWETRDGIVHHTTGGASTLEGQIVKLADRIAYINHDIDDAVRAGILATDAIPAHLRRALGETHGERIEKMVESTVTASADGDEIVMEPDIAEATEELHAFLYVNVYCNPIAKGQEDKAEQLLETLYLHFRDNSGELPAEYIRIAEKEGVERAVVDYISGMTDRYAIRTFRGLFIPEVWSKS